MKVCLDSRLGPSYLKEADEIKVQYRDIGMMDRLIEEYPNKTLVFELPFIVEEDIDWDRIRRWNILSRNHLILCLGKPRYIDMAKEFNIPWYMGYAIQSFAELKAVMDAGAHQVKLGEPLFFQMDLVKKLGAKVRLTPNISYEGFPREDGVRGQWVLPHHINYYEDYCDVMEFAYSGDSNRMEALYRIYKNKEWFGDIGLIINDFNHAGSCSLVLDSVAEARLNCGQRCFAGRECHICDRAIDLAFPEKFDFLKKETEN